MWIKMSEVPAKADGCACALNTQRELYLKGSCIRFKDSSRKKRSLKCKHVKRSMDKMRDLIQSTDNVNSAIPAE